MTKQSCSYEELGSEVVCTEKKKILKYLARISIASLSCSHEEKDCGKADRQTSEQSASSSSSVFPAISLGFTIFCEIFPYVTVFFFNPTIEAVTFCLHGRCMLGVFLLPAFTCLRHECQDLLSPCDEMHVCTEKNLSLYSHPKEF